MTVYILYYIPHVSSKLLPRWFTCYLMFGSFMKIFPEIPNLVKIVQKYLARYMKT